MIAERKRLFDAIRLTLEDKLLADMTPATWPASHVRSCLTLLTYLEDLVGQEQDILSDSNARMRALLAGLADRAPAWLDTALRERIATVQSASGPQVEALERDYVGIKEVLALVIRAHGAARRTGGEDRLFQRELRACLAALNEREYSIAKRAAQMPPF